MLYGLEALFAGGVVSLWTSGEPCCSGCPAAGQTECPRVRRGQHRGGSLASSPLQCRSALGEERCSALFTWCFSSRIPKPYLPVACLHLEGGRG